jgi:beta-galactosidase GanA
MTSAPSPRATTKSQDEVELPRLERTGAATQLIVDGKPFVIRGGELGNSSAERSYLSRYWPKLQALGLNAVVAPVYWDVVEPAEGEFDWTTVDELVEDARAHDMRLVLLWFGSWKNSMSSYVPGWVKTDVERFPRSRGSRGEAMEILTPFSDANRDADARAFAALMGHLRESDDRHTVVLVQVENEIGMIPEARDHTPEAERAFAGAVPAALMDYLQQHRETLAPELLAQWATAGGRSEGTWTDVFGDGPATDELFMAWSFARYVHLVTAAGKAELDLPMYTNAALIRPGMMPGQYPSAGPLPHLIDVWRAGAPALDFISPDIYFPNFIEWADKYVRSGNPLFIPEALRNIDAAANALYAYGAHSAIGFAPFGIESVEGHAEAMLAACYDVVGQLTPLITEHAGDGSMTGLLPPAESQRAPYRVGLGGLLLEVTYERVAAPSLADGVINEAGDRTSDLTRLPAGAIVIHTGPDEFVFGGIGVTATFRTTQAGGETIGILSCEEGRYEDGVWQHLRWLNGDQTHQGRHLRLEPGRFAIQRVKLYRYR